jgi:molybdopterin molybdotransferase
VADALAMIRARLRIVAGCETVPLAQADGRILAADILAPTALPRFDNAAVDGYALRHADLATGDPTTMPVAGRVPAGQSAEDIRPGTAARIFTGAPLPAGADTVVMQEDVRVGDGTVIVPPGLALGANRRLAGEDIAAGRLALPAGYQLGARGLALVAALGLRDLPVRSRLRVGLFSTGDEVSEGGTGLDEAHIHDANRPMLSALVKRTGAVPSDLGILRDRPEMLRARLAAAAMDHDLLVTTGGVSVGEEDHVKAALGAAGELILWRLAIKPGRPLAFGFVGETPFLGLPGNPGAAYVTALAILVPVMLHLTGGMPEPPLPLVRSSFALAKRPGRREFVKVCLRQTADGACEAVPAPGGALSGLAASDGLVELPEDVAAIAPGDLLAYRSHGIV